MTISLTDLAKAAVAVADRDPSRVYMRVASIQPSGHIALACVYYIDSTPSCLFGWAFEELGIDLGGNKHTSLTLSIVLDMLDCKGDLNDRDEVDRVGYEVMLELRYALVKAQQAQDAGDTWGEAVQPIREWLATYGWPEAKTIDGVEVTKGLAVWDYNLNPCTVVGVQSVSHGVTWFKTSTGMFDGSRMWVHHPSDGRLVEREAVLV